MTSQRTLEKVEWEWEVCAYHEAGHAVVSLLLGFMVLDVEIGARATFLGDASSHGMVRRAAHTSDYDPDADMVTSMAGGAAEARYGSPESEVVAHMAGDVANAESALGEASIGLDEALDRANELIEQCWVAIEAVAEALMENDGYLDGEDVAAIVFG